MQLDAREQILAKYVDPKVLDAFVNMKRMKMHVDIFVASLRVLKAHPAEFVAQMKSLDSEYSATPPREDNLYLYAMMVIQQYYLCAMRFFKGTTFESKLPLPSYFTDWSLRVARNVAAHPDTFTMAMVADLEKLAKASGGALRIIDDFYSASSKIGKMTDKHLAAILVDKTTPEEKALLLGIELPDESNESEGSQL